MRLFEYGYLLGTLKREIILLATESRRERRSTAANLLHQLQNINLLDTFPNERADSSKHMVLLIEIYLS